MNYKLAFALGLIAPATVGREPVAYLYNGVRLPGLPEWDKVKYPYVVMVFDSDHPQNLHVACGFLFASEAPIHITKNAIGQHVLWSEKEDTPSVRWTILEAETVSGYEWHYYEELTGFGLIVDGYDTAWANHDIMNTDDGTLYLGASDPIPVYE